MDERRAATDALVPAVYRELYRIAQRYLRAESNATLSPTALINEAYIEITSLQGKAWTSREHFLGVAAFVMRRVLSTAARSRRVGKRAGRQFTVSLGDSAALDLPAGQTWQYDLLDQVLGRLEAEAPELADIAVCRVFSGMTVEETATYLELSPATVKRRWTLARAWLYKEISGHDGTLAEAR